MFDTWQAFNSFDENKGVNTPREKPAGHECSVTVGFSQYD